MHEKVIIYQTEDGHTDIEVKLDRDTVWLSQQQMADLFLQTKQNISLHVNNLYREKELEPASTVKEYLTVQNESGRAVKRRIRFYNLDVIISVGYRVRSVRGTQFRIWANQVLKDYLVKGFAVNARRLEKKSEQLDELKKIIALQEKVITAHRMETPGTEELIHIISAYSRALDLLEDYDHQRLDIQLSARTRVCAINYREAKAAIRKLAEQTRATDLFGREKDDSFKGSLENIFQTFDGKDLYPSLEEKAAYLLYFVVKNHSFVDGNKRIAAFLFIWFLELNHVLFDGAGNKVLSDDALVALTLMLAESAPSDKGAL